MTDNVSVARDTAEPAHGRGLVWSALSFSARFDLDQAAAFTRLLDTRPVYGWLRQADPVVCELTATPAGLAWRLGMTPREAPVLIPQIHAQVPGVTVETAARGLPALGGALELRVESHLRTLRTDTAEAVAAGVLTAMTGRAPGEAVVLSWVIGPPLARPAVSAGDTAGWLGPELDTDDATALRAKLDEPVLGVVGRIGVAAATPERRSDLAQRVHGALELARAAGVGFSVRNVAGERAADRLARHRGPLFDWPPLNAIELAAVLGWPIGAPHIEGVTYRGARPLPPAPDNWTPDPAGSAGGAGLRVVGRATYPGRDGFVHLPVAEALRHLHVIGPTGVGKSVLLAHLIEADITAGRSVVVIEPKSDLIAAVLDRIPAHRTRDVVVLDPADPDHAVGLDALAGPDPELAADAFTHTLASLFRDAWGPRTSQIVYAAAVAVARVGGTLVDLPRVLTDPGYRRRVLDAVPDPAGTAGFWTWFDRQTDRQQATLTGPALGRLDAFIARRAIRGIVGQPNPRFTVADLFARPRVLLVDLARGHVGPEAARLLGALVLAQLWQATLAQATVPAERRRPVMAYVDEFQDYAAGVAADFGDMLAQARGLGLGLTLAHQGLDQLDATTRAGVLTNARSRVVFQAIGPDARDLAAILGGDLEPADLAGLAPYNAYATLTANGATSPPASIATLPPAPPIPGAADAARDASRAQWARPRAEVDAAILDRHGPAGAEPGVGLGGDRTPGEGP
jgi:hypothetical protein